MTPKNGARLWILALFPATACISVNLPQASASAGQGSGGTASSGQGSGGSAGGSTTGACLQDVTSQQLEPCSDAGACGCPLQCAHDPLSTPLDGQGRVCEAGCRSDSDCNILTACVGGVCSLVACGADAGGGTYAFACAMGDEGELGSCDVGERDGGRFGLCVAGGTSDGGCNTAAAYRGADGGLCLPGYFCFGPPSGSQGTCHQLCDNVTAVCPSGQSCFLELKSPPYYGYCQ